MVAATEVAIVTRKAPRTGHFALSGVTTFSRARAAEVSDGFGIAAPSGSPSRVVRRCILIRRRAAIGAFHRGQAVSPTGPPTVHTGSPTACKSRRAVRGHKTVAMRYKDGPNGSRRPARPRVKTRQESRDGPTAKRGIV